MSVLTCTVLAIYYQVSGRGRRQVSPPRPMCGQLPGIRELRFRCIACKFLRSLRQTA